MNFHCFSYRSPKSRSISPVGLFGLRFATQSHPGVSEILRISFPKGGTLFSGGGWFGAGELPPIPFLEDATQFSAAPGGRGGGTLSPLSLSRHPTPPRPHEPARGLLSPCRGLPRVMHRYAYGHPQNLPFPAVSGGCISLHTVKTPETVAITGFCDSTK